MAARHRAAGGLRAALVAALLLVPALSQAVPSFAPSKEALAQKASQKAMQYRDKPSGDKRCSNCLNFIPSGSCSIVEGSISPNGYCMAWAKTKE